MARLRSAYPVLRRGRQYLRPISFLGNPFAVYGGGELLAWSRILDDEEALCVVNVHGMEPRGARILVDAGLSGETGHMTVVLNTTELADGGTAYPEGSRIPVEFTTEGTAYVELNNVGASETVALVNYG